MRWRMDGPCEGMQMANIMLVAALVLIYKEMSYDGNIDAFPLLGYPVPGHDMY